MILGIGIDSVEIERFTEFIHFSPKQLTRLFSPEEIAYCLQNKRLSAQRFAVRFAAREALFKALSQAIPNHSIPLFALCRNTTIKRTENGAPEIIVNWDALRNYIPHGFRPDFAILCSLTHTRTAATAMILIKNGS